MTIRTRLRHIAPVLVGLSALIGGGCSAGGEKTTSTTGGTTTPEPRLTGKLEYESVPYNRLGTGLDYSNITKRPIRGARVLLLDAGNDNVLAETVSTKDGTYSFQWSGSPNVKIWVYAETTEPQIAIADNTAQNAKYVLESAILLADEPKTLNLLAGSGWTGSSYGKPRQAAPFAILDAAYSAARRFIDEGTPKPNFPKLEINWSVENRPEDGNLGLGQIGTSFWDGGEIYILGKEDVDTDEFDTHVIVHEWGHSFEDFIARSDSQGGSHGYGDVLDPRLAFSEGFCNALSGIILEPDTVYSDSSEIQQKSGFSFDVDENDTSAGAVPGWFSETTVENIVFDIYDGEGNGAESFDTVALGIPGIYGVMTGGMKTTPALTTIFPFVSNLKSTNASAAGAIDALVTHHKSSGGFGIDPVVDDWGTNESHAGDDPNALPVYAGMKIGDSKTVTLVGGIDWALLGQNRFLRFTGNGASVTVSTSSVDDVDLYVYRRGKEVASSVTTTGNESAKFTTTSGDEYVINVQGFGEFSGPYDVVVTVKP
jgi:hypothetical protein